MTVGAWHEPYSSWTLYWSHGACISRERECLAARRGLQGRVLTRGFWKGNVGSYIFVEDIDAWLVEREDRMRQEHEQKRLEMLALRDAVGEIVREDAEKGSVTL